MLDIFSGPLIYSRSLLAKDLHDLPTYHRRESNQLSPAFRSVATDCTQFMRWRVEVVSHDWCEIQVIHCDSRWRSETKALEERGEEDEELHPGQTFSETHPATCTNEQVATS